MAFEAGGDITQPDGWEAPWQRMAAMTAVLAVEALPIVRAGDPVLRRIADAVGDPTDPQAAGLVEVMIARMHAAQGVGLAAPQVAVSLRVIVFMVPEARAGGGPDDEPLGLTALVNPSFEPLDAALVDGAEGCLSLPGLRGVVPRYAHILYRGLTLDGHSVEREARGFHARVVQHEIDHLDGVLYLDRIRDFTRFGFVEELEAARSEL